MRDVNERNRLLHNFAQVSETIKKRIGSDFQTKIDNMESLEIGDDEKKELRVELQSRFQDEIKVVTEFEGYINSEVGRIYLTVDEVISQVFDNLYKEMAVFRQQLSADLGTIANELKDIKKKLSKK